MSGVEDGVVGLVLVRSLDRGSPSSQKSRSGTEDRLQRSSSSASRCRQCRPRTRTVVNETSAVERIGPMRGAHTWPAAPRHIAPRQRRRRRFPRRRRPSRPIGHRGTRRTHCTHAYLGSRTGLPYPPPKLSECGRRGETLWRCANRAKLSGYAADGQNSGVLLKHQFDHHMSWLILH